MITNWSTFEKEVTDHIVAGLTGEDVTVISEYYTREASTKKPSLEISIGTTNAQEESFSDGQGRAVDIHYGTVNLLLKTGSKFGLTATTNLIDKLKDLFRRKLLYSGYAKFRVPYKVDAGQEDGKKASLIICPFTFEEIT